MTLIDGTIGGGESIARQIAMHLDRSRFESELCVSRPLQLGERDRVLAELEQAGVSFLGLDRRSRLEVFPWVRLVQHMRRRRFDVLHTHKIGSNIWGALLAPVVGVPVFVAHEHTWSFQGNRARLFLDRELIARRADAFVAVSREDRRRMHEVEGIPLSKLRFIPNGISALRPPDRDVDIRADFGIGPDSPVIGAVATLRPQKALDVLVRAAGLLSRRFPALRLLIAGGEAAGPEEESVRNMLQAVAREAGVEERVAFLGHRPDVWNVLAALDVAVLSSDFEGSPLSVLEYMDAGKPVVATWVGGVPDLVEDGVTGLLIEPQDPAALATAIGKLLDDPDQAAAMGRAGRERRRREFSIEGTARRVGALYEDLYAQSGRMASP